MLESIEIAENLVYEKCSVQILDYIVKELQNKSLPLVKVIWASPNSLGAISEMKKDIRIKHPRLFEEYIRSFTNLQLLRTKHILRKKSNNNSNLIHANYFGNLST